MKKTILASVLLLLFIQSSYGQAYKIHLEKINNYLKTFDKGYYGYLEIADGYLYDRFPSGKYSKTLISDLTNASVETHNLKVIVKCKDSKECVFSTYTDSYHTHLSFSQSSAFNTTELVTLLDNLIAAAKGSSRGAAITEMKSNTVDPAATVIVNSVDISDKSYKVAQYYIGKKGKPKGTLLNNGDGWYSGMIEFQEDSRIVSFEKVKLTILK